MNIEQAKQVLLRTHVASLNWGTRASGTTLQSSPGIGKTESQFQYVEDLVVYLNRPAGLTQFMLATIQSADVRGFGIPVKASDGGNIPDFVFSRPPWLPVVSNTFVCEPTSNPDNPVRWYAEGEWKGPLPDVGVLFLDEFGQAEEDVKKPAAELIYKGNVGTWHLPKGWRVTAATNRVSDRSGVMRELMFLVNRRCLLDIQGNVATWLQWRGVNKLHYLTVSFARQHPEVVFRDSVPDGTDPFCTPRTLVMMDRDLQALRTDEQIEKDLMPIDPLAREVCAGWIGGGSAGQYMAHLKYADELPDPDDIVADPGRAKLPEKLDAQMVCAYMLAHHAKEESASPFMRYIQRLNIEMQFAAVRAINNDPVKARFFTATPEYGRWIIANKDVFTASQM